MTLAINAVTIAGTLGHVMQLNTRNGTGCRFRVEVPGQKAEKISCVAWDELAEIVLGLEPGKAIRVEGKLQTRAWTDNSGAKRFDTSVVASHVAKEGGAE